jgi:hypothetical protein
LHAFVDHVLNSIAASATYSDHLDDGAVRFGFQHLEIHDASVKIKNYSHSAVIRQEIGQPPVARQPPAPARIVVKAFVTANALMR